MIDMMYSKLRMKWLFLVNRNKYNYIMQERSKKEITQLLKSLRKAIDEAKTKNNALYTLLGEVQLYVDKNSWNLEELENNKKE